ncbi:hypothetical protein OAA96_01050 [Polaribacter sp.]|nr:hypothetical protein [Polaribacter sp.]
MKKIKLLFESLPEPSVLFDELSKIKLDDINKYWLSNGLQLPKNNDEDRKIADIYRRKEEISYKKNKPEGMDWPQTIDKKSGKDRDVKRTFSIWKKGKILYINTYASGSNTPPAEHFNEIQNELINKHLI